MYKRQLLLSLALCSYPSSERHGGACRGVVAAGPGGVADVGGKIASLLSVVLVLVLVLVLLVVVVVVVWALVLVLMLALVYCCCCS